MPDDGYRNNGAWLQGLKGMGDALGSHSGGRRARAVVDVVMTTLCVMWYITQPLAIWT